MYHKNFNEACLVQKFCQTTGARKKYDILLDLVKKGQLSNYIERLNRTSVGTGNSLLNEALAQAIQDGQQNSLIRLLSEDLPYNRILSEQTKTDIDRFLEEDKKAHQNVMSKNLADNLERLRLTTQIRHVIIGQGYSGPNLVLMTAAASACVQKLTDSVANNTLTVINTEEQPAVSTEKQEK